jgi:CelD/BcsL family acetyltransferase involved in cellulose biosynthesis
VIDAELVLDHERPDSSYSVGDVLDSEMLVSLDDVVALRDDWDRLAVLAGLPQMAPAWVLAWWRHLAPHGAVPRVVVVRERGELIGLAPFYVQDVRRAQVEYRLPGKELAGRLAPLAVPGREWDVADAIGQTLFSTTPEVDMIALEGSPLASQWPVALRDRWPGAVRPVLRQYHVHGCPTVSLRYDSFDAWLAGKSWNFRQQMRRHRRRFIAAGGTERTSTRETLDSDIRTLLRLHARRWEGRGRSKLVALGEPFQRMLEDVGLDLLAEDRFRLRLLEIDGEAVCAQLYLAAGGSVLYFNSGWDERFAHMKPSLIGMFGCVEDAFARGEREIDLGPGEQAYKLRFADGNDPVAWNLLMLPSQRLPLTYMSMLPTLAGSHLREGTRRTLGKERIERLRQVRSRLQR